VSIATGLNSIDPRPGISNPRPTEIPLPVNREGGLLGIGCRILAFLEMLLLKAVLEPRYRVMEVTVAFPPERPTRTVCSHSVSSCGLGKGKKTRESTFSDVKFSTFEVPGKY